MKAVCHPSPTCSLGLNMTSEATLLPVSAWELPGSFIHFGFVNIAGDLALTAMRQLLGFELQTGFVESRLDKLLLLQPDGRYHRFHETEKAPGKPKHNFIQHLVMNSFVFILQEFSE